jgi:hypothetical protein
MIIAFLAATALLAEATPAAAPAVEPAPAASPAAVKAPVADPNAKVCRNEATLGSRLPTKVCYSKADAARNEQRRSAVEQMKSQIRGPSSN